MMCFSPIDSKSIIKFGFAPIGENMPLCRCGWILANRPKKYEQSVFFPLPFSDICTVRNSEIHRYFSKMSWKTFN